jgi:hypothetical protein
MGRDTSKGLVPLLGQHDPLLTAPVPALAEDLDLVSEICKLSDPFVHLAEQRLTLAHLACLLLGLHGRLHHRNPSLSAEHADPRVRAYRYG